MKRLFPAIIIVLALFNAGNTSAEDIFIAPHEAQYILSLHKINDPMSQIVGAKGTMSYSLTSGCEGWLAETSIMMDLIFENGAARTFIWNLSTYEAFDKSSYSFALEDFSDENNPRNYIGNVTFDYSRGTAVVEFNTPGSTPSFNLPINTIFPIALYKNIIRSANEGELSFKTKYYDASSPTQGLEASTFTTMHPFSDNRDIHGDRDIIDRIPLLSSTLAFFTYNETPEFEAKIQLYNNGILKELVQTLGQIEIKGKGGTDQCGGR